MPRQIQGSQKDFSGGEVDVSLKRADDNAVHKTGCRQLSNWRILSSGAVKNRPGRTALFFEIGRVEEILMSPGNVFYLAFGAGYLRVYNAAAALVFSTTVKGDGATLIPWTAATVANISWAQTSGASQLQVYIFYGDGAPANVPQVLSWDGVSQTSKWTLSTFAETITAGAQKRTMFFRISPPNITLLPSASSGSILIQFSAPVLSPAMVGTRLEYCGAQMTITSIADAQNAAAQVDEQLPQGQSLTMAATQQGTFSVGQVLIGSSTSAHGYVTAVSGVTVSVQLIPNGNGNVAYFNTSDTAVGPSGNSPVSQTGGLAPQAVSLWTDEVMNNFRGWPTSGFFDQTRLGLCNFPSLPSAIAWSALQLPNDFYTATVATLASAIFELVSGKTQVLFVLPGMEGSEFVFCDNAVYYIPINEQSPLEPGTVNFNLLSNVGCQPSVQPRIAGQSVIYMKPGSIAVAAIQVLGAYSRPYIVDDISEFHSHLFASSPAVSIAVPSASTQFEELYIYVALANGTAVVGKYAIRNGMLEAGEAGKPKIGWSPWSGAGTISYISARASDVIFTTLYALTGVPNFGVVERLDNTQYLDAAILVNSPTPPFVPPAGKGPLWFAAGCTVTLIDQVTRVMDKYNIDVNGNIIPEGNDGENLAIASLVAGQPWTATAEPFAPIAQSGADMHQRMLVRRISSFSVYVIQSTGFLMAKLFSSRQTPTSPALGTIMNVRRVETWNQGDDPTQPPPLRETVEGWRPSGFSYDPRVAIVKDTPGPLVIAEIGMEVSI